MKEKHSKVEEKSSEVEEKRSEELNFNWVIPLAILSVLLLVPFSLNYISHLMASARQPVYPLIMKLPIINKSAITAPEKVTQFDTFDVSLHLNTEQLSDFINKLGANAIEGTTIKGIVGVVSPHMQAEISGKSFTIENLGPQEQLYVFDNETHWSWQVVPTSSGNHTIKFHLHLATHTDSVQPTRMIEIAEAHIVVEANSLEWMLRNWWWMIAILLVPAIIAWRLRYRFFR